MSATKPTRFAVRAVMALIAVIVPACSLPPANGAPLPVDSSSVLTEREIVAAPAQTAYDAVARLRPRFLKATDGLSKFTAAVYLDGVRIGGIEELGHIQAHTVREVRFLSAVEATMRYGAGRFGGALLVTTKSDGGR